MRLVLVLGALVAGLFFALGASPALAAPGDLDPTFSRDGKAFVRFGSPPVSARDALVQPDGKTVVLGNSSKTPTQLAEGNAFILARLKVNGKLDRSFSENGKLRTQLGESSFASAIASQPDGKLIVAGTIVARGDYEHVLIRYGPGGSVDPTFGVNGVAASPGAFLDLAVQPDGKIVATGYDLARFQPDGDPDPSFSDDGVAPGNEFGWTTLALQSDGSVVVGGSRPNPTAGSTGAVARYGPDGNLDGSFSNGGVFEYGIPSTEPTDVGLLPDERIVVISRICGGDPIVHSARCGALLTRLLPGGDIDSSLAPDGTKSLNLLDPPISTRGLAVQPDSRILLSISGFESPSDRKAMGLVRFDTNGSPDVSFSADGFVAAQYKKQAAASAVALGPGARALLAGTTRTRRNLALARFELDDGPSDADADGVLDSKDRCPNKFGPKRRHGCPQHKH